MGTHPMEHADWTADARNKETIVRMYHHFYAPPFSTTELAKLLSLEVGKVKQLVQELKSEGKLGYCERFGLSDLCYGLPSSNRSRS